MCSFDSNYWFRINNMIVILIELFKTKKSYVNLLKENHLRFTKVFRSNDFIQGIFSKCELKKKKKRDVDKHTNCSKVHENQRRSRIIILFKPNTKEITKNITFPIAINVSVSIITNNTNTKA